MTCPSDADALRHADAVPPRGKERFRFLPAQVVERLAVDTLDIGDILVPRCDQQQHTRAGALDQRVGGDGRAMDEPGDVGHGQISGLHGVEQRLTGLTRHRRRFRGRERSRMHVERNQIGKGASCVNAHEKAASACPPLRVPHSSSLRVPNWDGSPAPGSQLTGSRGDHRLAPAMHCQGGNPTIDRTASRWAACRRPARVSTRGFDRAAGSCIARADSTEARSDVRKEFPRHE